VVESGIRDPEYEMEKIRIQDKQPGSRINNPDPQQMEMKSCGIYKPCAGVRAGRSMFPIDGVPVEIIFRVGISRAPIIILVTLHFPIIVLVDGTVHLIVIV
jgi:hypothetical protein